MGTFGRSPRRARPPLPRRRRWPAVLAWSLWALAPLGLAATAWFDHLVRQAGRPELAQLGAGGATTALAAVSAATAGAVLAARRPAHPVGWLLLAFGLVPQALTSAADGYANYGLLARPGALPAAAHLGVLASATFVPGLGCIGFILLLTPTGSLPSARWRWWAWVAAALPLAFLLSWVGGVPGVDLDSPLQAVRNPFAVAALAGPLQAVYGTTSPATALTMVVAAGSLLVRFRRASGVERQQLRWLVLAAALAPAAVLLTAAGILAERLTLANWAAGLYLALLPLAIGASIARYRLYDLDRIISRTLAYALLTVLLGGGYARPPAPAARPRHPQRRAAHRGRPDDAAHQDSAVAAARPGTTGVEHGRRRRRGRTAAGSRKLAAGLGAPAAAPRPSRRCRPDWG